MKKDFSIYSAFMQNLSEHIRAPRGMRKITMTQDGHFFVWFVPTFYTVAEFKAWLAGLESLDGYTIKGAAPKYHAVKIKD